MPKTCVLVILGCVLAVSAAAAAAVEVKLQVRETAQVGRSPAVITAGVPFARGAVKDVGSLTVSAGGKAVPAQFMKTVPWEDGSTRWALMDVQVDVPAGGATELVVSDVGGNPAPSAPVKIDNRKEEVAVSTGPLQFVVSRSKRGLFQSLKVDGREVLSGTGRGPVIYAEGGGQVVGTPTQVTIEQAGPMRAIVCVAGKFPGLHKDLLSYTARVTAFAGRRFVKVHLWLENNGAMGYTRGGQNARSPNVEWFAFDGMAVELGLGLGGRRVARCEGAESAGRFKVLQLCRGHKFEYTITGEGGQLKKGERTDGVVAVRGDGGTMTAAIRGFWQNYEKAVELDGGTLRLWLWPTEGQWPRRKVTAPFDASLGSPCKEGLYLLPGAVHKGHEFILDFTGHGGTAAAELSSPLFALASAENYAATEAAPGIFAPPNVRTGNKECDAKLAALLRMARSVTDPASPNSILAARRSGPGKPFGVGYLGETSHWYGWMDFGDLPVPGRGFVSLHYDWPWIVLVNLLRTGDVASMRLASEMVRHRVDVDQLWSDRDLPGMRGLQRGDTNWTTFHCFRLWEPPTTNTNWLAGVVLYYMLTGEPKALQCAKVNGDALKAAWEHIARTKPWAGPQGDMAANGWSINCFCAMYDLTADRKWLKVATGLFKTNVTAKWKALGPFLHDPDHQIQSQSYLKDDMKYCYALASLCQLHRYTGDERVMKLLKAGCEKPFPDSFFEAPLFLSDLYAYVGHRTGNAAYLGKAAESFAAGFPESKCPPVFLPGNSTWSRTSAMMLRTGHLLQYVAWKTKRNK